MLVTIDIPEEVCKKIEQYCTLNQLDFNEYAAKWLNSGFLMDVMDGFMTPNSPRQQNTVEKADKPQEKQEEVHTECITEDSNNEPIETEDASHINKEQTEENKQGAMKRKTLTITHKKQ